MAAVAMCQAAPALPHAQSASACAAATVNERFYKFGTPSPPSLQQPSPPVTEYSYRSELEDSGFHSDEEIQKVRTQITLATSSLIFVVGCLRYWWR